MFTNVLVDTGINWLSRAMDGPHTYRRLVIITKRFEVRTLQSTIIQLLLIMSVYKKGLTDIALCFLSTYKLIFFENASQRRFWTDTSNLRCNLPR